MFWGKSFIHKPCRYQSRHSLVLHDPPLLSALPLVPHHNPHSSHNLLLLASEPCPRSHGKAGSCGAGALSDWQGLWQYRRVWAATWQTVLVWYKHGRSDMVIVTKVKIMAIKLRFTEILHSEKILKNHVYDFIPPKSIIKLKWRQIFKIVVSKLQHVQ